MTFEIQGMALTLVQTVKGKGKMKKPEASLT